MTRNDSERVDRIVSMLPMIMNSMTMFRVHPGSKVTGLDLTYHQYYALNVIHSHKKCTVNALAGFLKLAQSTTSLLIDHLLPFGSNTPKLASAF